MIDLRLYRVALLPALFALVMLLFSFESVPDPFEPRLAVTGYDARGAFATTRQLIEAAPSRAPGSSGDAAAAALVRERFSAIRAGTVSEQRFDATYGGGDVELRNVVLTLPGESEETVVLMAPRDAPTGPGAASSAAATAALIELAEVLGNSDHAKTIVAVSTDAAGDGALGAREFADSYSESGALDSLDAVVTLSQPGFARPRQPFVVSSSAGDESTAIQLVRTAERAVTDEAEARPQGEGALGQLARLAIPSGLGEQAVLIDRGIAAVTISSAGERPLPPADDQPDDLAGESLDRFGRSALATMLALDAAPAPPLQGPDAYVVLADNLVPGWALSVLALALILPAAVAAVDGVARAARSRSGVAGAIGWAGALAAPPLAALVLLYLLALVGLVPRPRFPFDPARFETGASELLAMLLLAAVVTAGYGRLRPARAAPAIGPETKLVGLGVLACAAVLVVWLANPYMALLVCPLANVWLLGALAVPPRLPTVALAVALALLPILAAFAHVVEVLRLGGDAPWHLVLMVADGQIGPIVALALATLIGCIVGLLAVAPRAREVAVGARGRRLGVSP